MPEVSGLGVHASPVCESLPLPLRKIVTIHIRLAPRERTTFDHADERDKGDKQLDCYQQAVTAFDRPSLLIPRHTGWSVWTRQTRQLIRHHLYESG